MDAPPTIDLTARAVRRLSVAVWILAIVVAANLVISVLQFFYPAILVNRLMSAVPSKVTTPDGLSLEEYNSFHDWPVERQVQTSSVIVLTKWEKSGSTLKSIITEILKQAPNTKFYYKVGDEYRFGSQPVRNDNIDYGAGQIIFFTGSPASARFSTGWRDDRITGLGDMPIAELRELIRKSSP